MRRVDPTTVLREEHRRILAVVAVLERALATGVAPDWECVEACVRFLRLYADACHHAKEEDELFPALEELGVPSDAGPIAALIEEHREGRRLLSDMRAALAAAREGGAEARARVVRAGLAYADLIRGHIAREDDGVFDMADHMIPSPACARLCAEMQRSDEGVFEGCTKVQLTDLAAGIVHRWG